MLVFEKKGVVANPQVTNLCKEAQRWPRKGNLARHEHAEAGRNRALVFIEQLDRIIANGGN